MLNQLLDCQVAAMVTECIVVNNRSTDGTEAAVQSWMQAHPQAPVRLLRNDQNYGLGGSHKVAFQYAVQHNFDYLIVLHGDDQGDIRDVLPLVHSGRCKIWNLLPWLPFYAGKPHLGLQHSARGGQLWL